MSEPTVAELDISIEGAMALATLDRPRALNSLTNSMRLRLAEGLAKFSRDPQVYCVVIRSTHPKAFSAGSDVREVAQWGRDDRPRARQAFRDEYSLNWRCECFSKPTVSLIDGMVMGGGVGISLYGTHRIAGEGYMFAMPETKIGLFPDVGVCHALSRMPDSIGMYLGLTGNSIGRADAFALGLVTHTIRAARFDEIRAALADARTVDGVLDERHEDPGRGELAEHGATIAHCFSADTVPEIVERLEGTGGADADWARGIAQDLSTRCPLSLAMTHRHIRESAGRDLRETLQADYRLAAHILEGHDFYEGVRALLVDKDNAPAWRPAKISGVTPEMVDGLFRSLGADELVLPTREEMQAARA
jgi:enoyl-CoA hydratase